MPLSPLALSAVVPAIAVPLCVVALMLAGWRRRGGHVDLAFALVTLGWTLELGLDLWPLDGMDGLALQRLVSLSYCVCVLALAFFCTLASGSVREVAVLMAAMAVSVIGTAWLLIDTSPGSTRFWQLLQTGIVLLLLGSCLRHVLARPATRSLTLCGVVLGGVAAAAYGVWLPPAEAVQITVVDATYLALVLASWVMQARHMEAVPSDYTDTDLFPEFDGHGPPPSSPAFQRALERERQRIAQELHDSIGSHLVGLIAQQNATIPGQRAIASELEECLLQLRIVVDSFHDDGASLVHSLGQLRHRVQPSLDQLGIQMQWDVSDLEAAQAVPPAHAKELLRITQEALSNVMRHSRATGVAVSLRHQSPEQALVLEICDNGCGLPQQAGVYGNGLAGMRRRAAEMGARLEVSGGPASGTCVRVCHPV